MNSGGVEAEREMRKRVYLSRDETGETENWSAEAGKKSEDPTEVIWRAPLTERKDQNYEH